MRNTQSITMKEKKKNEKPPQTNKQPIVKLKQNPEEKKNHTISCFIPITYTSNFSINNSQF